MMSLFARFESAFLFSEFYNTVPSYGLFYMLKLLKSFSRIASNIFLRSFGFGVFYFSVLAVSLVEIVKDFLINCVKNLSAEYLFCSMVNFRNPKE